MLNLIQLQDRLKDLSDRQLAEQMQMGSMPQYLVLSELQRRKKMRQDAQTPNQAPQETVAEELGRDAMQNAAMEHGVAALPVEPPAFASGGIVSFGEGGTTTPSKRYKTPKKGKAAAPKGPVRNAKGETLQQVMKRLGIPEHFGEFPITADGGTLGWELGTRGDSIDGSRVDITTRIPTDPEHFEELRPFVVTPPADAKRTYGRTSIDPAAQPVAGGAPSVTQVIPRFITPGAEASDLPIRAPAAVAPARSGVEALLAAPASGAVAGGSGSGGAEMSVPVRAEARSAQGGSPAMGRMPVAAPTGVRALAEAQGAHGAELSNDVYLSETGAVEEGDATLHASQGRTPTMLAIPGLLPPGFYTNEQLKAILGDSFNPSDTLPLEFSGGGNIWDKTLGLFGVTPKQYFTDEEKAAAIEEARELAAKLPWGEKVAASKAYDTAGSQLGAADTRFYSTLGRVIRNQPAEDTPVGAKNMAGWYAGVHRPAELPKAERAALAADVARIPGGTSMAPAAPNKETPRYKSPAVKVADTNRGALQGVNVVNAPVSLAAQIENLKAPEYNTDVENALLAQLQGKVDARKDEPMNMAMLHAGLAMMAGNSPYALQNIGAGGIAGLETYAASKKELRDLDKEIVNAKLGMETAKREGNWKVHDAHFNQLKTLLDSADRLRVANINARASSATGDRAEKVAIAQYYKTMIDDLDKQLQTGGLSEAEKTRLRQMYDNAMGAYAGVVGAKYMPSRITIPKGAVQPDFN
jgi:hypothetical protein